LWLDQAYTVTEGFIHPETMIFSSAITFHVGRRLSNDQNKQEIALIDRLCHREESALEALYHQYYPRIYRFVSRVTRRDEIIDEIINDVMFTVWEKAETYDRSSKVSTWIFGIAFNKVRHALRTERQFNDESLNEIDEDDSWLGKEDAALNQLEMMDWLNEALNKLSPEHRAVIELTYFEGLHYSEIAAIMSCPENTVKTRMHHARKNMALHLSPENLVDRHVRSGRWT
jgi:RNA polymerase sigma factor (sigma-70 family)